MMRLRAGLVVAVVSSALLLAAAASGCSKARDGATAGETRIPGLSKAEVTRAKKACNSYVARVCACAKQDLSLAETCSLAKASPDALQMNLDLLNSKGLKIVEQQAVKVEARKIAAACFASDSRLDLVQCPR